MNLVLLYPDDFQEEHRVRLFGERATHIREVHRVTPGDSLRVGLLGGPMGEGTVLSIEAKSVDLSVTWRECPPAPSRLELLLAMPRPKMLRKIVATVASIGVKRIVLINSARVEKSYFDSPLVTPAAIERELCLGLSQGRDTILPHVSSVSALSPSSRMSSRRSGLPRRRSSSRTPTRPLTYSAWSRRRPRRQG